MPAFEREIHRARAEAVFGPVGEAVPYLGPVSRSNPKAEWHNTNLVFDSFSRAVRVEKRNRKRKGTVH